MIKEKIQELTQTLRALRSDGLTTDSPVVLLGVMLDMLAVMEEMDKNTAQAVNTAELLVNGIKRDLRNERMK